MGTAWMRWFTPGPPTGIGAKKDTSGKNHEEGERTGEEGGRGDVG